MALTYSIADTALLDGFLALADLAGRNLTVCSDANGANVGQVFKAVTTPGMSIEAQTELGVDPRFVMSAEIRATDDLLLEHSAVVRDANGQKWKAIRIERNSASPVNKYYFVQVEAALDL